MIEKAVYWFFYYMSVCVHRLPASNETEPPKTIIKNNNNFTWEWNNCGQNHTSVKIFPSSECAARDSLWSHRAHNLHGRERTSLPRDPSVRALAGTTPAWILPSEGQTPPLLQDQLHFWVTVGRCGGGSLVSVHAWTPAALRICRRNTKWEGVQR